MTTGNSRSESVDLDTADVYGLSQSERLLGRLVREVGRDELVISRPRRSL